MLRPNGPTEVLSATSYADLLVIAVRDGGINGPGVLTKEEWREVCRRHFVRVWGPADLRLVGKGSRRTPKWINQQAWGIVTLRQGGFIKTRSKYIIRMDEDVVGDEWIAYASEGRRRKVGKVTMNKRRRKLTRVKKTPKVYCNIPDHFLVPLAV